MLHLRSRRDFLSLAALPALAPALAVAKPLRARAKSVIVVFASGGQSQIDTYDPKPDAPAEVRGAFRSITTRTPGVRFCEHLPELAKRSDKYALVRSMSHDDLDHGSACYLALTGHFHPRKSSNPLPKPTDMPALGAIMRRLRPTGSLPYTSAQLNGPLLVPEVVAAGQYGGLLGRAYEPLQVGDVRDGAAELHGLEPRDDVPPIRIDRRRGLLASLEGRLRTLDADAARDHGVRRRQAHELLASPSTRAAFDLEREPTAVRERYGRHRSGQACLLARRLVEAGVPLITVFFNTSVRGQDKSTETDDYGWDTHNDIFDALQHHLLPRWDRTFSALLDDLQQRGLLDSTLVIGMGEFGRAPLVAFERTFVGVSPGRKHWGGAYSIVMAGAGVAGGKVVGASDRLGAYPASPSYHPGDVAATIFSALGIDPEGHYLDPLDRPYRIAEGKVMREVFS